MVWCRCTALRQRLLLPSRKSLRFPQRLDIARAGPGTPTATRRRKEGFRSHHAKLFIALARAVKSQSGKSASAQSAACHLERGSEHRP